MGLTYLNMLNFILIWCQFASRLHSTEVRNRHYLSKQPHQLKEQNKEQNHSIT